ncbi:MAG: hypothetical protein AB1394_13300, partial [Bacteroidota bacterium]
FFFLLEQWNLFCLFGDPVCSIIKESNNPIFTMSRIWKYLSEGKKYENEIRSNKIQIVTSIRKWQIRHP